MIKTIDELLEDAGYLQLVIDHTTADVEYHKSEALKSAAQKVIYQQQLDAVERALIIAHGEPS